MYRAAESLIPKPEFFIIGDPVFFARQHQAFASLPLRLFRHGPDQLSAVSLAAVLFPHIQPEYHLPGTGFLVQGSLFIHAVLQIGQIGDHPVDESDQLIPVRQEQEMGCKGRQAVPQRFFRGRLGGRKTGRFQFGNGIQIMQAGCTYKHGFLPFRRRPTPRRLHRPKKSCRRGLGATAAAGLFEFSQRTSPAKAFPACRPTCSYAGW